MLTPATAPHSITACCSYLPTLLLGLSFWILAIALSNPNVNPVMQTLTHPSSKAGPTSWTETDGHHWPYSSWLWIPQTNLGSKILALKNLCSVIYSYYLPSHLQCHPALPSILIFPQWLRQKLLFLPLYFHTSFYKPGKALRLSTADSPPSHSTSANPLGSSRRDINPALSYIFLFPSCSCICPVGDKAADQFCWYTYSAHSP